MKKLFFLLSFIFIFQSCSSDENTDKQSSPINPPEWLIGTWVTYYDKEHKEIKDKFIITTNDIVEADNSTSSSWKTLWGNKEPIITTEEIFNANYYAFKWTESYQGQSVFSTGYFIKKTATSMMFNNYLDDEGILYYKQ